MNVNTHSHSSFESKLNYIYAFSVVASLESFSELNDDIQQAYFLGISEMALQAKLEYQELHKNKL